MKKFLVVLASLFLAVSTVSALDKSDLAGETYVIDSMGEYSGETLNLVLQMAGMTSETFFSVTFNYDDTCEFNMMGEDVGTVYYECTGDQVILFENDIDDSDDSVVFDVEWDGKLSVYIPGTGTMTLKKKSDSSASSVDQAELLRNLMNLYSEYGDYDSWYY